MTQTQTLALADLGQFTGSESWYRHGLNRKVLFTDGARYLADKAGAYWLIDEIALAQQFTREVAALSFQCWTLKVNAEDGSARLCCTDGNGSEVFAKSIPWTDFPLPEITLFVEGGPEQPVILLPTEH